MKKKEFECISYKYKEGFAMINVKHGCRYYREDEREVLKKRRPILEARCMKVQQDKQKQGKPLKQETNIVDFMQRIEQLMKASQKIGRGSNNQGE